MEPTTAATVLELVHARRSVRRYRSDPVPEAILAQLLDAAVWAPSAVNGQPWAFGIIQDRALLDRCAGETASLYLHEPPAPALEPMPPDLLAHFREIFQRPGYELFHGAGTLVVIYATSPQGVPDCYLAAENLMLAACALGLGTCPIGLATPLFDQPDVKAELGVEPGFVVALPIVVGVPEAPAPPTSRNPARILYRR